MESVPSRSAMLVAVVRGLLRLEVAPPWVLDDPFALVLAGPAWRELRDQLHELFPGPLLGEVCAAVCTRGRLAEDRLAAGAFTQYVILGADRCRALSDRAGDRVDVAHDRRNHGRL